MVVEANNGLTTNFACKCLNVRINASPPPRPRDFVDADYKPVYVGDDGIVIVHTQLTLRIRSRSTQHTKDDTVEMTRYVSLQCLVCRTLVYRVFQVISPDIDSSEGPVAPSEEWAERELLKSVSGWIDVSSDCITGDTIAQVEASPLISRLFGIVLPSDPPLASTATVQYSTQSSVANSTMPIHHLPALQPLFLSPPFTPTHPVFRHISNIATAESSKLREEAEAYLRQVVEQKATGLEAAELKLKQEVELLWLSYQRNVYHAAPTVNGHRSHVGSARTHQRTTSRSGGVSPGPGPANGMSASVRVHEFVPSPSLARRASGVISPAQQSALSSSLATSSFHHSRPLAEDTATSGTEGSSPPPYSPSHVSPVGTATGATSLATASSRTLTMAADGGASIRDAYRRNMDESIDIATSFKFVSDLQAEMTQRHSPEVEAEVSPPQEAIAGGSIAPPRGRSPRTNKSSIKMPKTNGSSASPSTKRSTSGEGERSDDTPTKSKRKVTFDVKPDVAIIKPEGPVHKIDDSTTEQEPVFDMENERDDLDSSDPMSPPYSLPTTPTVEPVRALVATHRIRPAANLSGLPSSLSTLRPASLPTPSMARPPIPHDRLEDRPRSLVVREAVLQTDSKSRDIEEYRELVDIDEEPADPRETEILKLVAANTPSHRSAWKKDSKAWQIFVARHGYKERENSTIVEEEEDSTNESNNSHSGYYDESEDDTSGLEDDTNLGFDTQTVRSLPIAIIPLSEHRHKFGVPSYQPKTSLSDRPGILVPPLRKGNSETLKRASYAERDRARSIDPGALDFTVDEVDEDEDDDHLAENEEVGGRGRQRALKILEKGSEVPAEGMWRSLA